MKLFLLIFFLAISCDKKVETNVPIEESLLEQRATISIEKKIIDLGEKIENINEAKVIQNLDSEKKELEFSKRLKELKLEYNELLNKQKKEYTSNELTELEMKYSQTKEIWDYLKRNYRI